MLHSSTWVFVSLGGKLFIALCCSCDTAHLSTFPHDIYKLVEKQPFQFWSFLVEYFTYSWVGETAWWGLSKAIKSPCEIWMALSVISDISARCYMAEWPREEIAWILISIQRFEWSCQAPFINCWGMITFMWVRSTGVQWSEIVMTWKACNVDYYGKR